MGRSRRGGSEPGCRADLWLRRTSWLSLLYALGSLSTLRAALSMPVSSPSTSMCQYNRLGSALALDTYQQDESYMYAILS